MFPHFILPVPQTDAHVPSITVWLIDTPDTDVIGGLRSVDIVTGPAKRKHYLTASIGNSERPAAISLLATPGNHPPAGAFQLVDSQSLVLSIDIHVRFWLKTGDDQWVSRIVRGCKSARGYKLTCDGGGRGVLGQLPLHKPDHPGLLPPGIPGSTLEGPPAYIQTARDM